MLSELLFGGLGVVAVDVAELTADACAWGDELLPPLQPANSNNDEAKPIDKNRLISVKSVFAINCKAWPRGLGPLALNN